MRAIWLLLVFLPAVHAQEGWTPVPPALRQPNPAEPDDDALEWVCPMDKDIRSSTPGKCPRCGMTLVHGIPEAVEYPVRITTTPQRLAPDQDTQLDFKVSDPKTGKTVKDFEIVHDKLFHLFIVSQDTSVFFHIHPEQMPDGTFRIHVKFPKAGEYRVLCDIYPKQATPQLISHTLIVPGKGFALAPPVLQANVEPQQGPNLKAELVLDPPQPLAGVKTLMYFRLTPNDGIEKYLSAWAHMMAASSDLIDMIHTHPIYVADPENGAYKQVQFNIIFPRTGVYKLWVQFQRKGVVNTFVFNVPVTELK